MEVVVPIGLSDINHINSTICKRLSDAGYLLENMFFWKVVVSKPIATVDLRRQSPMPAEWQHALHSFSVSQKLSFQVLCNMK